MHAACGHLLAARSQHSIQVQLLQHEDVSPESGLALAPPAGAGMLRGAEGPGHDEETPIEVPPLQHALLAALTALACPAGVHAGMRRQMRSAGAELAQHAVALRSIAQTCGLPGALLALGLDRAGGSGGPGVWHGLGLGAELALEFLLGPVGLLRQRGRLLLRRELLAPGSCCLVDLRRARYDIQGALPQRMDGTSAPIGQLSCSMLSASEACGDTRKQPAKPDVVTDTRKRGGRPTYPRKARRELTWYLSFARFVAVSSANGGK